MWIITEYESTTLFSLKPATATASGGKTLLVPTPFTVKMALLDVACRVEGVENAKTHWQWLNALQVAIRPAERVVVNNTFIKILKPRRNPAKEGSQDAGYFGKTIIYREYAYFDGTIAIALRGGEKTNYDRLGYWLTCINYLGKRGSFMQSVKLPYNEEELPQAFIEINGEITDFGINTVMTQLDDTGLMMTFDHADIYNNKQIRLGQERILKHTALPYRLVSSSRGYSFYELMFHRE